MRDDSTKKIKSPHWSISCICTQPFDQNLWSSSTHSFFWARPFDQNQESFLLFNLLFSKLCQCFLCYIHISTVLIYSLCCIHGSTALIFCTQYSLPLYFVRYILGYMKSTILFALEWYGVSQHLIEIVKSYYGGLWSQLLYSNAPSSFHKHLRGISTGCTPSIILFLTGMNIIIECICAGAPKLMLNEPPCFMVFIDGIFFKSATLNNAQKLLNQANTALSSARMPL